MESDQPLVDVQRARLQQQLQDIDALEQVGNDAAGTVELDQARVGRLSRMDALQGQAMSQETRRRRQLLRGEIVAALARMEAGDYGLCIECDNPIAAARLDFEPSASRCIECASALDQNR